MQKIFIIIGDAGSFSKTNELKEIQTFIGKTGTIISVTSNVKNGDTIIVAEKGEVKNPLD